jgi:hypothetical protein
LFSCDVSTTNASELPERWQTPNSASPSRRTEEAFLIGYLRARDLPPVYLLQLLCGDDGGGRHYIVGRKTCYILVGRRGGEWICS